MRSNGKNWQGDNNSFSFKALLIFWCLLAKIEFLPTYQKGRFIYSISTHECQKIIFLVTEHQLNKRHKIRSTTVKRPTRQLRAVQCKVQVWYNIRQHSWSVRRVSSLRYFKRASDRNDIGIKVTLVGFKNLWLYTPREKYPIGIASFEHWQLVLFDPLRYRNVIYLIW